MVNRKEKDALVIGDDSEVYSEWEDRKKENPDLPDEPTSDDYEWYWDDVYEVVGSLVREREDKAYKLHRNLGSWYCEVSNFGWRGQSGVNIFDVQTYQKSDREVGMEFLRHVLPNTDCTFYIYDDCDGFGLAIDNAHHDAPMGGEWYHCAPIDWMIATGNWFGIQNDSDEMIGDIYDALLEEWETEFLNKELSAATNKTGDRWWQGSGQRVALDIEFPTLYKKFIAGYGASGKHLQSLESDLEDFFKKYYASRVSDEWTEYVLNSNYQGFENELGIFIRTGNFQVDERSIPDETYQHLKKIYEKMVT